MPKQVCVTIPDDHTLIHCSAPTAKMPEVIQALCDNGQRPADSPLTKAQFAQKEVANFIKRVYVQGKAQRAAQTARDTATADAEAVEIT